MSDTAEHFDKLGQKIEVGDYVAYPSHNSLDIGLVKKLNPKMVKVSKFGKKGWGSDTNKYPNDCVLLDGKRVTLYVLKNSAT